MRRIVFGEWTLVAESGELSCGGPPVRLQEQVLKVLLALLERPGELVTREELIALLWPAVVVDYDTSLKSIVRKLRLALGDDAERPRYVETLPRKGYRFIGTIEADGADAAAQTVAPPGSMTRSRRGRAHWAGVAMLVLASVGVTLALLRPADQPVRLAVMPFETLSLDPGNAFFTDSLHEEVVTALRSSSTELDVVPRATMMSYRGRPDPIAAAVELGATHVLEAAVRRDADNVRVNVSLMRARDNRHLWTQTYDRVLRNSMTLQSEVAAAVAAQLAVKLSNRGGGLAPSAHPEAHDLYRRALVTMQSLDQRTPTQELGRAEDWLDTALALDETFAAAYVRRAQLRISKYVLNHDVSEANREAARLDIERARSLAGDAVAVVQASSRYSALFETGPDAAVAILDTLELAASREPEVLRWRGFFLCRAGRTEQGLDEYALAATLDPGNPAIVSAWVRELWALRRPLDALEIIRAYNERQISALDFGDLDFAYTGRTERLRSELDAAQRTMAPDSRLVARFDLLRFEQHFAELEGLLTQFEGDAVRVGGFRDYGVPGTGEKPVAELEGWTHLLLDRHTAAADDGRAVLAFVEQQTPTPHNDWHLRMLEAEAALFAGEHERAVRLAGEALQMTPPVFDFVTQYSKILAARIYAWGGSPDEAVDLLEELATQAPSLGPAEIARDPFFVGPLADHPRYQELAARLEAQIEHNRSAFAAGLR
jgi:TolB-like protein/DNA-binding winged helix-turn-helix (wHTH) protein